MKRRQESLGKAPGVEKYRSGHNERDSKSCCPQGHVGSNPTFSAIWAMRARKSEKPLSLIVWLSESIYLIWRRSSAGRALASHARGHWFESSRLHHVAPSDTNTGSRKAWLVCFAALALLLRKKARLRSREKTFTRPSLGFFSSLAYHFFAVLCIHSKFQIC